MKAQGDFSRDGVLGASAASGAASRSPLRRFLLSEPSNPLAAAALVTALVYGALLLVRLVLSASLFQGMDVVFVPATFALAFAARVLVAKRRRQTA
ncbi:hypothetical protein [Streptomyces sp. CC208A]|uniref:hypothetical protein n=1 Tax=Streptomyces sp. CC208A TaxID=3044573 RepID=UPI0024A8B0AA|nr:hypothetical protein [Streptomyces sp. CC208A]